MLCISINFFCVSPSGKVYAMGRPEYGRLGVAEVKEDLKVPTVIPTLQGIRCVGISCGSAVSLSVSEDGEKYFPYNLSSIPIGFKLGKNLEFVIKYPLFCTGRI